MSSQYENENDLIVDLRLMFNNARTFNEDSSQIYKDANTLEKAMKAKVMKLSIQSDPSEEAAKRSADCAKPLRITTRGTTFLVYC